MSSIKLFESKKIRSQWDAEKEIQDPEKSIDRAMENYLKLGYSKE